MACAKPAQTPPDSVSERANASTHSRSSPRCSSAASQAQISSTAPGQPDDLVGGGLKREAAWIAEVDGRRAGCIFLVAGDEPGVARLRTLLVTPEGRGLGIGTQLVRTCLEFAARAGYRKVTLWTNDVLVKARRIYEAAGFVLVDEEPHTSFGQRLVGQNWDLDLEKAGFPLCANGSREQA